MIFVRDEDAPKLGLSAEELRNPEVMFVSDWITPTRVQRWKRKLKFMTPQRAWVKCVNAIHGMARSEPQRGQRPSKVVSAP